jgi:hypothetical protein
MSFISSTRMAIAGLALGSVAAAAYPPNFSVSKLSGGCSTWSAPSSVEGESEFFAIAVSNAGTDIDGHTMETLFGSGGGGGPVGFGKVSFNMSSMIFYGITQLYRVHE